MAREHAILKTNVWRDPDWKRLTRGAQWTYELLLSQSDLTLVGVVPFKPRMWSGYAADATVEELEADCAELEREDFVVIDRDTDELWIRSFIRHNRILGNTKLAKGCARQYDAIHSEAIRRRVIASLPDGIRERFPQPLLGMTVDELKRLLVDPLADPVQPAFDFETREIPGGSVIASPIGCPTDRPSDAQPIGHAIAHGMQTENVKPKTENRKPPFPPDSDFTVDGPDLRVVGEEDPLILEALELLAQRDLSDALARQRDGAEPVRSPTGYRSYRLRERRAAHLADAQRILREFVIDDARLLVELLDGTRSTRYCERRSADA